MRAAASGGARRRPAARPPQSSAAADASLAHLAAFPAPQVMAASIKEVRDRIGSVSNTKKITEAMKLVAAAKVRRAQEAVVNGRPFAENLVKVRWRLGDGGVLPAFGGCWPCGRGRKGACCPPFARARQPGGDGGGVRGGGPRAPRPAAAACNPAARHGHWKLTADAADAAGCDGGQPAAHFNLVRMLAGPSRWPTRHLCPQQVLYGVNQRLRVEDVDSPLVAQRPVKSVALVVVTGDRGLCGGYNK